MHLFNYLQSPVSINSMKIKYKSYNIIDKYINKLSNNVKNTIEHLSTEAWLEVLRQIDPIYDDPEILKVLGVFRGSYLNDIDS